MFRSSNPSTLDRVGLDTFSPWPQFPLGETSYAQASSGRGSIVDAWICDAWIMLDRPERSARMLLPSRRGVRLHVEWQQKVLRWDGQSKLHVLTVHGEK